MAKRRSRGEGAITERADGRWMAQAELGWRDGKRRRKTVYGRTKGDVVKKLRRVQRVVDAGLPVAGERQTVAHYLTAWVSAKRSQLRPRTYDSYANTVRLHLIPGLGRLPLAKLTPQDVATWWTRHQDEDGASARTIRYARSILRNALNQAARWDLVARNASALTDAPRHVAREIQPLTPEQARTLLTSVTDHRLGALISVGLAIGLRIGECLGLRWVDVNMDAGTLRIAQALERSGGDAAARRILTTQRRALLASWSAAPKRSRERRDLHEQLEAIRVQWREVRTTFNITEPKSKKSRRTIRMPAVALNALRQHRTRQLVERMAAGPGWEESGLVFTTPIGTPLDARNVTKVFKGMLAAAGLPDVRLHDTRHTAATLLLAQGVAPKVVQETLGHSSITLTLDTYSHLIPALQQDAADKMDAILSAPTR